MRWRYAKESVRNKIEARSLTDDLIEDTLSNPDSILSGSKGRLVAQKEKKRAGYGALLIRVVYETLNHDDKVVVTAYWTRPDRYKGRKQED